MSYQAKDLFRVEIAAGASIRILSLLCQGLDLIPEFLHIITKTASVLIDGYEIVDTLHYDLNILLSCEIRCALKQMVIQRLDSIGYTGKLKGTDTLNTGILQDIKELSTDHYHVVVIACLFLCGILNTLKTAIQRMQRFVNRKRQAELCDLLNWFRNKNCVKRIDHNV